MRQEYDFSGAKLNPYIGKLRNSSSGGEQAAKGGYFTDRAERSMLSRENVLEVAEPKAAYV
jgi:hypothetical protein